MKERSIPITLFSDLDNGKQFFIEHDTTLQEFEDMITSEMPKIAGTGVEFYAHDAEKDVLLEDKSTSLVKALILENFKIKAGRAKISYDVKNQLTLV